MPRGSGENPAQLADIGVQAKAAVGNQTRLECLQSRSKDNLQRSRKKSSTQPPPTTTKPKSMEILFATIICAYQKEVAYAVKLLSESGIEMPYSNREWLLRRMPSEGRLAGGVSYKKHGYGVWLGLPNGEVDFDFGDEGQTTGLDEWRLKEFCKSRPDIHPVPLDLELREWFRSGLSKGDLIQAHGGLYYVTDAVSGKKNDTDRILTNGCGLPHYSHDKVITIFSECFGAADVMLGHYESTKLYGEKKGGLSRSKRIQLRVYLLTWLGYLHSTMEAFQSARVRLLLQERRHHAFREAIPLFDELNSLFKPHSNDLRVLRNNVFHLLTDIDALDSFLAADEKRLSWATELHHHIAGFFSKYRVLAELHYFNTGRMSESVIKDVARERKTRRSAATRAAKLERMIPTTSI